MPVIEGPMDTVMDKRMRMLVEWGVVTRQTLRAAEIAAAARGLELEKVLIGEFGVPRCAVLHALSAYYCCDFVEYNEKLPVPPELLTAVEGERLSMSQWFPVIRDGETVIIAANNPRDPLVIEEVQRFFPSDAHEFRVALGEDIQWFIQDFLHAAPGQLIGTERTGLAYWRNTMAQWRTRLACYRNDLAQARTELAMLRWGLGFVALTDTMMRTKRISLPLPAFWLIMAAGLGLALWGLSGYIKMRRRRLSPPGHHTLVEVTAATMTFLEDYHYIETEGTALPMKQTMLSRLGDLLSSHCTILYPSPASRERTHLARERNVLAAQRTVAACYRTIYARARTGLAFIRTGVSFTGLGLGLMHYFAISVFSLVDALLIVSGLLLVADGLSWYLPVRREQAEVPRCPVPQV